MGTSVDAFVGHVVGAFVGGLDGLKTGKSTLVGPVVGPVVGDVVGDLVGVLVGPLVGPLVVPLVEPLAGRGPLSPAVCVAQDFRCREPTAFGFLHWEFAKGGGKTYRAIFWGENLA